MKSFFYFPVIAVVFAVFAAPSHPQDQPAAEQHIYTAQEISEKLLSADFAAVLKTREDLVAAGAKFLPALLEALKDKNPNIRFLVLEIIAEIKDQSAAEAVMPLLDDTAVSRASIASAAAKTLGILQCKEAVPKLVAALKSPDIDLRYEAIRALGLLGAPEAEEPLINILKNKKDYDAKTADGFSQVCAAIEALGNMAPVKKYAVLKLLGEQLTNGRSEIETPTELSVSYYAAQALKKLTVDYPQEQTPENAPPNKLPEGPLTGSVETVKRTLGDWMTWWHRNRAEIEKKAAEAEEPIGPPAPPAPPSENSTPVTPEPPAPPQTPQEHKTPPAPPETPPAPPAPPSNK